MVKSQHYIALLGVLAVALVGTAPASAEFKALNSKAEGVVNTSSFALIGGGVTISCLSDASEASSKWIIENEKEHTTKGSKLVDKSNNWGLCSVGTSEKSEGTAKSTGCELEVSEPSSEATVKGKLLTTCLFSFQNGKKETCEVKLEPTHNTELKNLELTYSGELNTNTNLGYGISNAATSVNSACKAGGVNETKSAKWSGVAYVEQVAPGVAAPEFTLQLEGGGTGMRNGENRTIKVYRASGTGTVKPRNLTSTEIDSGTMGPPAETWWDTTNVANCLATEYFPLLQTCPIGAKLLKVRAAGRAIIWNKIEVESLNGDRSYYLLAT